MRVDVWGDGLWEITGVTCATCGVMPWWQADGFLKETELGVVKPERLVDYMGCRLHVHLADGHRLAVFCFKCNLWRKGERPVVSAACKSLHGVRKPAVISFHIITRHENTQGKLMG